MLRLPVFQPPPPREQGNAPGPFYVVRDVCLSCNSPIQEAGGLMGCCPIGPDGRGGGCRFDRQPASPVEVERAIRAMDFSCVRALRYGGDDPDILRRLIELGLEGQCDQLPFPPAPVVVGTAPVRLAYRLRRWLRNLRRPRRSGRS